MKLASRIKELMLTTFGFNKTQSESPFHLTNNENDPDDLVLFEINEDPPIEITPKNLLCIKSKGNQSVIFYKSGRKIKKQLVRKSLKAYTTLLESKTTKVIRCHKSYIANLNKLDKISGTKKGYKIHIQGIGKAIPVSRKLGIDDLNQLDMFPK